MTRKDYEAIAKVLRGNRAYRGCTQEDRDLCNSAIDCIVDDMADLFAADNPRFDRDRFIAACQS